MSAEMGLHAYCVVPAGVRPDGSGLDQQPVRSVETGAIGVWVSEHRAPPPATVETARTHDQVVRRALDTRVTPVPLRYGQWLDDEAALIQRIAERGDEWRELLAAFAGAVEMGLTLRPPVEPAAAVAAAERAGTGTEYMRQLAARVHARDRQAAWRQELLDGLRPVLAPLVLRERVSDPQAAGALWLAHLVRREDVDAYRAAASELGERLPDVRILTSGPWPPYSFAA